jgi:hypothetical protein
MYSLATLTNNASNKKSSTNMKNKMLFNLPLLTYFLIMSNPAITGETNEKLWIPGNPFLYPGEKVLLNEVVAKTPHLLLSTRNSGIFCVHFKTIHHMFLHLPAN